MMKRGYVLPVTVFMLALAAVVVASSVGFVSHAARQTRIYLARSRCRFAAQSTIEQAKVEIQAGFNAYAGGSGAASIKVDPRQADVYDWFDVVSGDHRTIGKGGKTVTLVDPPKGVNDCEVTIGIGKVVEHESNSAVAIVPIVATAVYKHPDGLTVSVTIQERVIFGTGQSKVFDYAYFVNNYGWMNGSTITINGDMRANGNVNLSGSTVNGYIYAAANDELGVSGTVTLDASPQIQNQSDYRRRAGTRARPDKTDYDTSKSFDAPKSSGTIVAPTYSEDEDGNRVLVSAGTVGASSKKSIVNEESDSLPMPFVSDLDSYVAYAQEKNGRLTYPSYSFTDSLGTNRTVSGGTVYAHYTGAGPSGDADAADNGALVLVGTASNPIEISGPVVVDSDVIIKGYVKGKGTIYSGRNVHIVGDIKYVNAPSWGHEDADDEAVDEANDQKDMLGLVAKGNIVVGNSASSSWRSTVNDYINSSSGDSVVHSYACDASDANIGYPSTFGGDYTAVEQVPVSQLKSQPVGGYDSSSGQFGKVRLVTTTLETTHEETYYDWGTRRYKTRTVNDTMTELKTSYDRRYYETVCDDALLNSLTESGISQLDAVMYNNHGTFGTMGSGSSSYGGRDYWGSSSSSYVNINGSLVCRDEALIFQSSGLRFNWDFRLRSKDSDTESALGLPVGPQDPYTYDWMEVPDSLNPAYAAKTGGST